MRPNPIKTAGVALTRERDGQLEVLWARRPASAGFLGGFYSYCVGRVESGDADTPADSAASGSGDLVARVCALRELFEEAGLLVLADHLVASWTRSARGPLGSWGAYRDDLLAGAAHLASDLRAAELRLGASRLVRLGSWLTPSWIEPAFHTDFFSLHLTEADSERLDLDRLPEHAHTAELAFAEWVRPAEALERWRSGRALMTTPIVAILEVLANSPRADWSGALERRRAAHWREAPMEIAGGLRVLPLETNTLPPATHTNCYLVGGERFVVVDPGSADAEQRRLLDTAIDQLVDAGATLEAIVLTHHHRDHVDGVEPLVRTRKVPLWAHPQAAARLDGLEVARELSDGEVLDLGAHALTCLHTPGHAPGHLCLHHQPSDCVLVGDLVASEGTIVIDPPDGNLGDYMESLERVQSLDVRTLLPAHGWAITQPDRLLQHYLDHRRMRERAVLDALAQADGAVTPLDLVPEVYDDVPAHIWPLAARSLLAHLLFLVEKDYAESDGERFWATAAMGG